MSGNIFKDASGSIATKRIDKADILPTLRWLEQNLGLPLSSNVLGSVGKKASSGDIDVAVDQNSISKDELISKLDALGYKGSTKKSGISVHFKAPICGDEKNGYVQVDFMFGDDIQHMKFGLFSAGDASSFSGADRNLLMSSIAKSLPGDLKYSWQRGLIRRSDSELISKDPDKIAIALLGSNYTGKDFDSVESIISALRADPKRIKLLRDLAVKLKDIKGKKPGEVKADTEESARITRILTQLGSQRQLEPSSA